MDPATLSALEFRTLKELLGSFVRTPQGRRALSALAPSGDASWVRARKSLSGEALRHHLEGGRLGPSGLEDTEPVLERLRPAGAVLEPLEILRLVALMQAADSLRQGMAAVRTVYPALWSVAGGIPDFRDTTRGMAGLISAEGRVEDGASQELARLRRRAADLEARLHSSLQSMLDHSAAQGLLRDAYVTVRNGRFVLPVRAEARSSMAGIVHGASSTGATVFVEPLETLELNNDLVECREQEAAEVRRILERWSGLLHARRSDLLRAGTLLGDLDLLGAIGVFGVNYQCVVAGDPGAAPPKPRQPHLQLGGARHPVLESGLRARGEAPVPLDIEMRPDEGALVLSGPNAGGKTVALKTIGLLALMNQSGLPVPAREALLPVFVQVIADIGDHQSIAESLSTFSARMVRVARMSEALSPPALVLLDEVGSGTDPEEAGALAVAIVDHFLGRGAAVVATTHHEALKAWAQVTPGAANASMEIDEETLKPTYRLQPGVAGRSGGIDLAERVGLPPHVVADARSRLSSGHRETGMYTARLQEMADSRQRELDQLRSQRERERLNAARLEETLAGEITAARERWARAVEEALQRIDDARDRFIAGLEDRTIALQLRAEARRQSRTLREELDRAFSRAPAAPPEEATPAVRPGTRVRLQGIGRAGEVGVVESIDAKGRARVLVRGKRVTMSVADMTPVASPAAEPGQKGWTLPEGVRLQRRDTGDVPSEINLIGMTVEEGLDRLDKFLDDAFLAGHARIRIVHGHGTGRLRAAVREMLEAHPHVESCAQADERSGGAGATEAVMKS